MIKAPYNFVPLSEKVVMPFWAQHISQDIPFENAKSGTLKLKIKAESPIYVRNGIPRDADDDNPIRNQFNNIDGHYFIPGSSIKGMLRSVVEIMSFGRMNNKVNPDKYSIRDFQNTTDKEGIYPLRELSQHVECGWLYRDGEEYFIDKCGKPGRISHENLDVLCQSSKISTYYKSPENVRNDPDKAAKSKNEKFNFVRDHKFSLDYESAGRAVYKIDNSGKKGAVVMTGQPGVRKEPKEGRAGGKHLEFIFWDRPPTKTAVPEEVIKNFFFAYYDHDKTQQNVDWKWRKKELNEGKKIPVFYRTHRVSGKEEFLDIGLTMLYKISYNYSILDAINNHQENADSFDMAESIFGFVDDQKALKGRVHIGHAFVSNKSPTPLAEQTEVLAGPKASYYPNYIEQNPNDSGKVKNYKTFMDNSAQIRGWKRYPIHSSDVKHYELPKRRDGSINYEVVTKFIPLPKTTEFTFDIAYHNLRKEELGALISAITFHNTDGLYHSIGSAKPLGYGKIKVSIEDGLSKEEQENAMKSYETYMDYVLKHSTPLWFQSEQIKELFAMAKPGDDDSKLNYMELTEFVTAKKNKSTLQKYTSFSGSKVNVQSLADEKDLKEARIKYQDEIDKFKNLEDIEELKSQRFEETKKLLEQKIKDLKERFQEEIRIKRTEAQQKEMEQKKAEEEEERLTNRAEKQKDAQERGFVLSDDFEASNRNAFNILSGQVLEYAADLHNMNENQLKKQLSDKPWVQEMDFDLIKATVKEVYKNLPSKKEEKKWKKKPLNKNFAFRKVQEWLGDKQAKTLFEEFSKP